MNPIVLFIIWGVVSNIIAWILVGIGILVGLVNPKVAVETWAFVMIFAAFWPFWLPILYQIVLYILIFLQMVFGKPKKE